jgi:hypothetical protein
LGVTEGDARTALRNCVWVVAFAISFAWVESAIVVYLREIYYAGKFNFPLVIVWGEGRRIIDPLLGIELAREIATIIMLVAVGYMAGKNQYQRIAFFMIAFGIWDIFYYIWLYVMVSWPESLMTWDLLFSLPLPWVGPVITPVLIAIVMVVAGALIIYCDEKGYDLRLWRWYDTAIEFGCGGVMIMAFCWDWKNILQVPGQIARTGLPNPFAWWLYVPAYIFSIIYFSVRLRQITIRGKSSHPS